MKKSKTASAGKSRSTTKKPPARAAEAPRNALRDLAPKGKAVERLPPAARAKAKPAARKPRPGLFQ
jgi:hypothetical protein